MKSIHLISKEDKSIKIKDAKLFEEEKNITTNYSFHFILNAIFLTIKQKKYSLDLSI